MKTTTNLLFTTLMTCSMAACTNAADTGAATGQTPTAQKPKKVLVVYYSYSGNTEAVAKSRSV